MRILIACESSGVTRSAFRALGFDAWSCDLLPADDGSEFHIQGDAVHAAYECGPWDLMIAHPPCTYLAVSGNRWHAGTERREQGLEMVRALMAAPIPFICIENPVSVISSRIRKPDQTVQPWQFGHGECKRTCYWLKGLPKLEATDVVEGREQRIWKMPPGPLRWKERSKTFEGIAAAMAAQWGEFLKQQRAAA
jgi:hypothetical protein